MSRKPLLIVLAVLIVVVLAGGAWYFLRARQGGAPAPEQTATAPATPQQLPDPVILVVNRNAIMRDSKVGRDIARQIGAYADQAKNNVLARQKSLEADMKAQKGPPTAALYEKQRAVQALAQQGDQKIQTALTQARGAVEQQLGPILKQVVNEHHANLVLDQQAVPLATSSGFDITAEVIADLDQKMPSYQTSLTTPGK